MPVNFGLQAAQAARYAYERYVYTGGPLMVPPGVSSIFSVSGWNKQGGPTWRAELVQIGASRNANLLVQWSADRTNQINAVGQGSTLALPPEYDLQDMFVAGISELRLQVINTTAPPMPLSNIHLNYAVAMRRLSAADKVLAQHAGLQGYTLLPHEEQALKALDLAREVNGRLVVDKTGIEQLRALVNKGTSPIGLSRLIEGLYENRELQGPADLYVVTVDTTDNTFAYYRAEIDSTRPTRGRFLLLTEIAVPTSPLPDIWLRVDRDGQPGILELRVSELLHPGGAVYPRIPAVDHIALRASLASGTTPVSVPIRVRVRAIEMSEVLAVQFGLVTSPEQLENPRTYHLAIAGLV